MKGIVATVSILVLPAIIGARDVRADDNPGSEDIYSYAWNDSHMKTGVGVSAILGGGITGFTDKTMRDSTTGVGGLWNLRVTLGSHTPLGLELGYLGSAEKINALIGSQSTTLVGTTAEAALRYNILPHYKWNPYAFAGIGWQRYDVTGSGFTLSDTGIRSKDNSMDFPMGAGISYRDERGLVLDARGTFRANTNSSLVLEQAGSTNYASLHTWEASAAVGYEF